MDPTASKMQLPALGTSPQSGQSPPTHTMDDDAKEELLAQMATPPSGSFPVRGFQQHDRPFSRSPLSEKLAKYANRPISARTLFSPGSPSSSSIVSPSKDLIKAHLAGQVTPRKRPAIVDPPTSIIQSSPEPPTSSNRLIVISDTGESSDDTDVISSQESTIRPSNDESVPRPDRSLTSFFLGRPLLKDKGGDRPYKCPRAGCSKSYKNYNGLTYHKAHGHSGKNAAKYLKAKAALRAAGDLSHLEVGTTSSLGSGDEYDKRYACPIGLCEKRYKNMNGLKYHLEHTHQLNPQQLKRPKVRQSVESDCPSCKSARENNGGPQQNCSVCESKSKTVEPVWTLGNVDLTSPPPTDRTMISEFSNPYQKLMASMTQSPGEASFYTANSSSQNFTSEHHTDCEIIIIDDSIQSSQPSSQDLRVKEEKLPMSSQRSKRLTTISQKIQEASAKHKRLLSTKRIVSPLKMNRLQAKLIKSALPSRKNGKLKKVTMENILHQLRPTRAAAKVATGRITHQYNLGQRFGNFPDLSPERIARPSAGIIGRPRIARPPSATLAADLQLKSRLQSIHCTFYNCDAVLGCMKNYERHMRHEHAFPNEDRGDQTEFPYVCLDRNCQESDDYDMDDPLSFETLSELLDHFRTEHFSQYKHLCPYKGCEATFKLEDAERHLRSHSSRGSLRKKFQSSLQDVKPPLRKTVELVQVPGFDLRKIPITAQYTPWALSHTETGQRIKKNPKHYALEGLEGTLRRDGDSILKKGYKQDIKQLELRSTSFLEPMRCEGADLDVTSSSHNLPYGGGLYKDTPLLFKGPRFRSPDEILLHPFRSSSGPRPVSSQDSEFERPSMSTLSRQLARGEIQPDPRALVREITLPPIRASQPSSITYKLATASRIGASTWSGWRLIPVKKDVS